jgi:succinoglycan biosynthesis protein ExoO
MANWRGERYLGAAIASVLAQSLREVELLIADDASDDRSQDIARDAMARDPRVRLLPGVRSEGPSAARNRALAAARGEWVAIVDSDDLLHPRRLELLLAAARRFQVDMVADDMVFFGQNPDAAGRTLLGAAGLRGEMPVDAALFVQSNNGQLGDRGLPPLGYLKALIRRSALQGVAYRPEVRVGEDFDFYLRLLLQGARLLLVPLPLYHYRRHSASLSHRLSVGALESLLAAHDELSASWPSEEGALGQALEARGRMLRRALSFERLVADLKQRSWRQAAGAMMRRPHLLAPLVRSLSGRVTPKQMAAADASGTRVVLVAQGQVPPVERDGWLVLEVPPLSLERLDAGPELVALACRLSKLVAQGPVEALAVGRQGLDGLGLLPEWKDAEVWLPDAEQAVLPPGARLAGPPGAGPEDKRVS